MDHTGFLNPEVDLAALQLCDSLRNLVGCNHRTHFRVRHQTARAENPTNTTNLAHHVACRDGLIELQPVFRLNLGHEIVGTNDIRTCGFSCLGSLTLCEHGDTNRLTGSVRQADRATDHLIRVLGINAEPDCDVHALVEFCSRAGLDQFDSLPHSHTILDVESGADCEEAFTLLVCH